MITLDDIKFTCHWHDMECSRKHDCEGCKFQPADDDKINGKAEPVHIKWQDSYENTVEPVCPACGESALYILERCVFCGQRFLTDDRAEEMKKPAKVEHMDCFSCGAKNGIDYVRSSYNGHRHGECRVCGMRFVE